MVSDELLEPLRSRAAESIIVVDYDGTTSAIVEDPATAVPVPGVVDALMALRDDYLSVTVVSGRPLDFLTSMLPDGLDLVGLYGLEGMRGGRRWEHPNGGAWREVMADLAASSTSFGPAGMRVELKDLSLTLHYRSHPELRDEVTGFARSQAERAGLVCRPARMSVELHPPIDSDKGTVVTELAADARGVLFAGDDIGDLPAFDALDRLAAQGLYTVRIGVRSDEAPEELLSRADAVVDGPDGVVEVLGQLSIRS